MLRRVFNQVTSSGKNSCRRPAKVIDAYQFWNPAIFLSDYDKRRVQLKAKFLGVSDGSHHPAETMVKRFQSGYVCFGLTSEDAEKAALGYTDQQWAVFIPKDKSDPLFSMKEGTLVVVEGVGEVFKIGQDAKFPLLVVSKIEAQR